MKSIITLASFREHVIQLQKVKNHTVLCRVHVSVYWKQETQVVISVTHNTTWASNDFLLQNVAQKSLDTADQMLINWQVICATG